MKALVILLMYYYNLNSLFSAQLTKAYQTANVLFEVLKAVNLTQAMEVDREVRCMIFSRGVSIYMHVYLLFFQW